MLRRILPVVLGLCAVPLLAHGQAAPDRYGPAPQNYAPGGPSSPQAAASSAPPVTSVRLRGRVLSWPGKAATPGALQPQPQPTAYAAPAAGLDPRAYAARANVDRAQAYAVPLAGAPVPRAAYPAPRSNAPSEDGWRPVFASPAASSGAPGGRALPTSIYAPGRSDPVQPSSPQPSAPQPYLVSARAAAAPPPRGSAAQRYAYDPNQPHAVRFYSLHRPFGLQPDPAPIPPQFFTATADLAEPPAAAPTERSVAGGASGARTVRAAPDTAVN